MTSDYAHLQKAAKDHLWLHFARHSVYKDHDIPLPPVITFPLTATDPYLPRIVGFIESLDASPVGSRSIDEDVHLGLEAATLMRWRPDARQVMVLIGDAEAHPENQNETFWQVRNFVQGNKLRAFSTLFVTTPSSLSAGNVARAYFQALAEAATRCTSSPSVAEACAQASGALALGVPLPDAIRTLAEEVDVPAARLLADVVAVHHRRGGDLGMLCHRLSQLLHERARLDREARALTAQARFTARAFGKRHAMQPIRSALVIQHPRRRTLVQHRDPALRIQVARIPLRHRRSAVLDRDPVDPV